jgi:hypothetical protein
MGQFVIVTSPALRGHREMPKLTPIKVAVRCDHSAEREIADPMEKVLPTDTRQPRRRHNFKETQLHMKETHMCALLN